MSVKCVSCRHNADCAKVSHLDDCTEYNPATNADRLRTMTDEELMSLFQNICCPYSLDMGGWKERCEIKTKGCGKCWIDWLKQEVDNET